MNAWLWLGASALFASLFVFGMYAFAVRSERKAAAYKVRRPLSHYDDYYWYDV